MPPPGWRPNPAWPPMPPGWQLYVSDVTPANTPPGVPSSMGVPAYSGPAYSGPAGYPGDQQAAPKDGTNGFAIAALILGILGGVILSIAFGIAALVQIRKRPQRGKGLAIAGLVLSGGWILLIGVGVAIALVLHSHGQPHRSASTGQITAKGTVSIWSLRAGDCFQNPSAGQTVRYVTADPCTTPHNAQIFAEFTPTGASFPGNTALDKQARLGCQVRVAGTVDKSKITGAMRLLFLFPPEQSWADGHRTIVCFIATPASSLTSSLLALPATS
jgi:hypothetical protein